LRENGRLGYIIPNTWLLNLLYVKTRNFVFRNTAVEHIIHYRRPVFSQATVDTEIVVLKKGKPDPRHRAEVQIVDADGTSASHKTRQSIWRTRQGGTVNILETPAIALIGKKMRANDPLERLAVATQGTKPFQVGKGTPPQTRKTVDEKPYVSDRKRNSSFRPLLRGSLMNRYTVLWRQNYWISFGDWLAEPRYSANSDAKEKIIIRQTGDSLVATLDRKQFVVRDNLYTIIPRHDDCNLRYLLGLINSRPLNWFYQNVVNPERGEALAQVKRGHIAQLPIPEASTSQRNRMVSLVDAMLAFHERAIAAKSVAQREVIQRQIDATDAKIDRLVCELYGLTKEEIAIVEGAE
jgi:hypothetical protein